MNRYIILVLALATVLLGCGQGSVQELPNSDEQGPPVFLASNAQCSEAPEGALYVDKRAVEYGDGLSFAEPYKTIREALLYVPAGGHLCIAPGTYQEGTIRVETNVTLEGAIDPDEPEAEVILDGEESYRILQVTRAVTLRNLSLTRGKSTLGGGGAIYSGGSNLTLLDTRITDSVAHSLGVPGSFPYFPGFGGGVSNSGGLTIGAGSVISGNSATEGGGVYNAPNSTITIVSGAEVSDNSASEDGGGILNAGTLTITSGTTVSGNSAGAGFHGGGIYQAGTLTAGSIVSGVTGNTPDNLYDPTP